MKCEPWIDSLYSDKSLIDNLDSNDAERLLSWSESYLAECETPVEASRLIDSVRLLNRYVKEGEGFDDLFAALRANSQPIGSTAPLVDAQDSDLENFYPEEPDLSE